MNKIGLLFDMDGVIVHNHEFHFLSWQKLSAKYGMEIDEDFYREKMNGRTLMELMDIVFRKPMSKAEARIIGEEKEAMYRELYKAHLTPNKGLIAFLEQCRAEEIPMVVGTSAPLENVDFTLDGLGIRHYFKGVLDERAVTKGKPDPQIYQKCAALIDKDPKDCVVFEDAVSGIRAGKASGAKVVALATSHRREELTADMIIDDFTQISLEQIHELLGK